jgi:hypothetical protein
MADPTGTMTISFAVSATPKVALDKSEGFYQAQTVIHEDIRTSLGGSGEVTSDDTDMAAAAINWADGVNTPITSSDTPVALGTDEGTDVLIVKHTGFLADGTASVAADTLLVQTATNDHIIAELKNGEAIVLPRPRVDFEIKTGNGVVHVKAEVTILGT